MLICRYHVLGVFLLMMITSDVVLAEDADDEDEGPGSKNTTVIDVSLIPGFRILFSADKKEGNVLRLALRPDPQTHEEGRGKMKNMMFPFMAIGQLFTLAFMPFMLMNLKAMAMNALMMNNMALTGAIVLTIRNILFNDRTRKRVIYPNLGYKKDESHRPEYPPGILHNGPAKHYSHSEVVYHQPENYHQQPSHPEIFHHEPPVINHDHPGIFHHEPPVINHDHPEIFHHEPPVINHDHPGIFHHEPPVINHDHPGIFQHESAGHQFEHEILHHEPVFHHPNYEEFNQKETDALPSMFYPEEMEFHPQTDRPLKIFTRIMDARTSISPIHQQRTPKPNRVTNPKRIFGPSEPIVIKHSIADVDDD